MHEFLKFGIYFAIWSVILSPKKFIKGYWAIYDKLQGLDRAALRGESNHE